jgi:seryl-tRNA synthetase
MLDLRLIREHPELVRRSIDLRHTPQPLDELLQVDEAHRRVLTELEQQRKVQNDESKRIGATKDPEERIQLIAQVGGVSERIKELEATERELRQRRDGLLMQFPNLPDEDVPVGEDERDNVVVYQSGAPPELDFQPLPHWEIGERLGIIDFERGVKLSGSRFYVLKGLGAVLERALVSWMLELHRRQGYTELGLPYVVKEQTLWAAGQLPKFEDNLYHDVADDLWLVPTAEVPITNLHGGEIMAPGSLPLNYAAYTPCFRREKMSAGRDVRGIKRGHQFDKVEMYKVCAPEESDEELKRLLAHAEETCRELGLVYRVLELCGADLGFGSAKTFDVEVWAPGCGEWLEVSSCSNVRDFQARRAGIRFRRAPGARPEFAHTLNGSGLGLPRTLIAVLENYQQPDGSVIIPEVLRPYTGGAGVIGL